MLNFAEVCGPMRCLGVWRVAYVAPVKQESGIWCDSWWMSGTSVASQSSIITWAPSPPTNSTSTTWKPIQVRWCTYTGEMHLYRWGDAHIQVRWCTYTGEWHLDWCEALVITLIAHWVFIADHQWHSAGELWALWMCLGGLLGSGILSMNHYLSSFFPACSNSLPLMIDFLQAFHSPAHRFPSSSSGHLQLGIYSGLGLGSVS